MWQVMVHREGGLWSTCTHIQSHDVMSVARAQPRQHTTHPNIQYDSRASVMANPILGYIQPMTRACHMCQLSYALPNAWHDINCRTTARLCHAVRWAALWKESSNTTNQAPAFSTPSHDQAGVRKPTSQGMLGAGDRFPLPHE